MIICLERGADLHVAQLMPLPPTVSYFSKIQIGSTFLVPAHPGSPGQRAVKRVCGLAMQSLSLVMNECSLSGRGQGHVSNFYIADLKKILPQQVVGIQVIYTARPSSVFVYDTLPPTKPPTSYQRFGQDLSYK